ncbi:oxidoreductase [Escherichia coli]|uniref:Oxidoreductase n=1 Tax=Escherichia coli TaxID=562 RepID=A0A376S9G7_ECOLX|nr:oxidoreductase [Escherichia coli]
MSDNIRVGLIGYGYASKTFHAPLIAGTPGLETGGNLQQR